MATTKFDKPLGTEISQLNSKIGNVSSTDLQTQITALANKTTIPYRIISDLNISDTYGLMFVSYKPSNAPIEGDYIFTGFMIPYDANNVTQIAFSVNPAHSYIRQRSWGTWSAWTMII